MALTERLQILVTADAKGAAAEFQKVGATADRELSRTEDRLRRTAAGLTSFGTQLGLAGGVATVGMFKLASAAGDYGEAVSAAGVIFGDAADDVEAFGEKASKTAGLSARAAVDAANQFGTFGKAAGLTGSQLSSFSTDLTALAGDLASFKNTTPEEAVEALGSALRGEAEPLRKYGVLLDDATLKQKATELGIYDGNGALTQQQKILAANAAIWEQTTDAQGDFIRTGDSLANQQRTLSAEFENLQRNLGEGAVPVFQELLGGVNGLLEGFSKLDPGTQDIVGKVGAIGAVGATAAGGLSFLAGQALNLREALTTVGADGERSLNRIGQAARLVGGITAAVGAVYALDQALSAATVSADSLASNMDRFTAAENGAEALSVLIERTKELDGGWDDLRDTFSRDPFSNQGALIDLGEGVNAVTVDIGNLEQAMSDMANAGQFDNLALAIEQINSLGFDRTSIEGEKLVAVLDVMDERVDAAGDAAKATGEKAAEAAGGVDELGNAIAGSGDQAATAAEQWNDYADAVKAATDPFFAVVDANTKLAEAQAKATEAQAAYNSEGTVANLRNLEEAQLAAVRAAQDQEVALIGLRGAVENGDVAIGDAVATLQRWQADGRITKEQADLVAFAFGGVATQANALDGKRVGITVDWSEKVPAGSLLGNLLSGKSIFGGAGGGRTTGGRQLDAPRAAGGPVWPGGEFMVNERGGEMFVPSTNGFVMNHQDTKDLLSGVRQLLSGGGAGGSGAPMIGEYHVHTTATAPNADQLASDAKFVKALLG